MDYDPDFNLLFVIRNVRKLLKSETTEWIYAIK